MELPSSPEIPTLQEEEQLLLPRNAPVDIPESSPWLDALVLYFMAIHFLLAFCEIILVTPLIKLFEESLCLSYYNFPADGLHESCKIPEIQRPLATIRGWKSMFDTIPVLAVAIPIGKLGDRYGRRKILALSLVGVAGSLIEIFVVCAFPRVFPLRLVWLSSIVLLCGGGLNSASAFMWAMASESIPEARRSHSFYYIFSAFYVAELLSSFVASLTLDISPWIPSGLALGSIILCIVLLWLIPSPDKSRSVTGADEDASGILDAPMNGFAEDSPTRQSKGPMTVDSIISALSTTNILLVVPVFLVGIFRYTTLNILIQYSSVRFGIKISTGATFYTETAIVNIILFLILIPRFTAFLRKKYEVRPEVIDLILVRASVLLMCVGSLGIGLSPSSRFLPFGVLVFAAGFGSRVSALSLVSYWISDDAKATLYAAISVLESVGHAIGDPSMQQIYAASLELPPFWQALPFFVAAGLYGLAVISTSFL